MHFHSTVLCIRQRLVMMYLTTTYNTVRILIHCIDIIECYLRYLNSYKSQCIIKL